MIVFFNPLSTTPGKQPLPLSIMALAAVLEGKAQASVRTLSTPNRCDMLFVCFFSFDFYLLTPFVRSLLVIFAFAHCACSVLASQIDSISVTLDGNYVGLNLNSVGLGNFALFPEG